MDEKSLDLGLLAGRVGRLERQNRILKTGGALGAVALGAALLMGQAAPAGKVIKAESFVVVDGQGKERAVLGMQGGNPYFALRDEKGNPRAVLSLARRGESRLELFDGQPIARAVLEVARGENPGLFFFQHEGGPQLILSTDRGEDFACRLYGRDGKVSFEAPPEPKR